MAIRVSTGKNLKTEEISVSGFILESQALAATLAIARRSNPFEMVFFQIAILKAGLGYRKASSSTTNSTNQNEKLRYEKPVAKAFDREGWDTAEMN